MGGGSEGAAQSILHRLHIPWPEADEHKLREAASTWRELGSILDDAAALTNRESASLTSANYGAATEAFEKRWSTYGDNKTGLLPLSVDACKEMAKACDEFAGKVEETKRKIERVAIEVGATLAIGAAGAIITFGAAEAAAASTVAWLSSTVLGEFSILGASAAEIVAYLGSSFLYNAFTTAFNIDMLNSVKAILGDDPPGASDDLKALLKGTFSGTLAGVAGKGVSLTSTQVAKALDEAATATVSTDPVLSQSLAQISRNLTGASGKIIQGVTGTAASQLIMDQELNGRKLTSAALNKSISEALEKAQS